jgi:hypothetical protein
MKKLGAGPTAPALQPVHKRIGHAYKKTSFLAPRFTFA